MAKKKETQTQVEQIENAEEVLATEKVAEKAEENLPEVEAKETEEKPAAPKAKKTKVEIPVMADSILKAYPNYKELYIDKLGGVFTTDTQPSLVKDAILYQNPYFNK